jgi:hypothetical protein
VSEIFTVVYFSQPIDFYRKKFLSEPYQERFPLIVSEIFTYCARPTRFLAYSVSCTLKNPQKYKDIQEWVQILLVRAVRHANVNFP